MIINKLKINEYGKLHNKEIELSNNINIIYGNNESGKSTLFNFIINSLYGISKNKKGRDISDFDKYLPWGKEEFSGKIEYELDNKEKYEIYRDFKKKNPIIYNKNHEDISKEFNIDKNKGNQFFEEQTKINENIFLSTFAIMQKEVKLEKDVQNLLIQKISNIISTGKHNTSYKKAIERINKRQTDEIGTSRTRGKPINVISEKLTKIEQEKSELGKKVNIKQEKEESKKSLEEISEHKTYERNILKEIINIKNNQKIEQEKINIKNNIADDNENKINYLEKEKSELEKEEKNLLNSKIKNKKKLLNKKILICLILFILMNIVQFIFVKNKLINYIFSLTTATILIFYLLSNKIKNKNNKKIILNKKQEIENKINSLENEIKVLKNNKNNIEKEIEKNKLENNLKKKSEIEKIKNKYNDIFSEKEIIEIINYENPENEIDEIEKNINNDKIKVETINIELKNIEDKIERYSTIEEERRNLLEERKNIETLERSMQIAKDTLTSAYEEMKNNINPQFVKQLSINISKITNKKYKNIIFNDKDGLIIELENGQYISADRLSVGTIEQIYLALRFAILMEITEEKIPVFLDEAFAFYDTDRLKDTLKYFNSEFKDRQIIIFTCTRREKEILESLEINYNYVEL